MTRSFIKRIRIVLYLLICIQPIYAQQQPASLREMLQQAEQNYPLLKSKALDVQPAQQCTHISKDTIIPTLDASYQTNYASHYTVTGMAYPQYLVPISGPPSTSNNMSGVFGCAASLLLNWQPVAFGQRQAQVDLSQSNVQ